MEFDDLSVRVINVPETVCREDRVNINVKTTRLKDGIKAFRPLILSCSS